MGKTELHSMVRDGNVTLRANLAEFMYKTSKWQTHKAKVGMGLTGPWSRARGERVTKRCSFSDKHAAQALEKCGATCTVCLAGVRGGALVVGVSGMHPISR